MHRAEELDEETYAAFLADVQLVIDACPVGLLASGTGHGPVTIKDGLLRLNGQHSRPTDAQCDTIIDWLAKYDVKTLNLDTQRVFFYRKELSAEYRKYYSKYDGSHETLCIDRVFTNEYRSADERGWLFDCTKTAQKPYDIAVVAILVLFASHFPEACSLSSDGDAEEWYAGRDLAREATGKEWLMVPPEIKTALEAKKDYLARLIAENKPSYESDRERLRREIAETEEAA
jgi:hypothetical protein